MRSWKSVGLGLRAANGGLGFGSKFSCSSSSSSMCDDENEEDKSESVSSRYTFSFVSRMRKDSFTVGFSNNPDIETDDTEDSVCTFKSASGEDNAVANFDGLAQNLNVISSSSSISIRFVLLNFLSLFFFFFFTSICLSLLYEDVTLNMEFSKTFGSRNVTGTPLLEASRTRSENGFAFSLLVFLFVLIITSRSSSSSSSCSLSSSSSSLVEARLCISSSIEAFFNI